jgi:hypothetical protein
MVENTNAPKKEIFIPFSFIGEDFLDKLKRNPNPQYKEWGLLPKRFIESKESLDKSFPDVSTYHSGRIYFCFSYTQIDPANCLQIDNVRKCDCYVHGFNLDSPQNPFNTHHLLINHNLLLFEDLKKGLVEICEDDKFQFRSVFLHDPQIDFYRLAFGNKNPFDLKKSAN